jgi:hypothetical protein
MLRVRRLIWDAWDVAHIARHEVTPDEVEQVCHGNVLVQQGHSGRTVLVGPTVAGRMLEIVLDPEPNNGVYYVVTAHPASKKDRALYDTEKEVTEDAEREGPEAVSD